MTASDLDQYIAAAFMGAGVRFYHAENLRNFSTYCSAGAILSRAELIRLDPLKYTRFYSDHEDERLGALSHVFGNIYDFGSVFARGRYTIPNIYGPVTLVFKSAVFADMTDITITPHSIVTHLDAWQSERVIDTSAVDEIVSGDSYGHPVAGKWQLCELSCAGPSLSFATLEKILVEPIAIGEKRLIDYVRSVGGRLGVPIAERHYQQDANVDLLQGLVSICESLPADLDNDAWFFDAAWLWAWSGVTDDKRNRLPGWCRYFYFGTLTECRFTDFIEQMDEADDRTVCELCDPGSDAPPALVNYRPADLGGAGGGPLDVGHCDYCNGISVRCRECKVVHSFYESQYDKPVTCDGGCGIRFVVNSNRSSDGSAPYPELLDDDDGDDDDAADA